MNCKWEELTSEEFAQRVQDTKGTCIVPLGVIEKHGNHLPLGTDLLLIRKLAEAAAEIEPAMVFPPYFLTQIFEGKHQPGAIAIPHHVMFDLLDSVCSEISRNGLKKIILLNGHGGNHHFLHYFSVTMLERERDYTLYVLDICGYQLGTESPEWKSVRESEVDGHGGEQETSLALELIPKLVRMDQIANNGMPLHRCAHLNGLSSPIGWYASFPNHYAGDARFATAEKGKLLKDYAIRRIAELTRIVKADVVCPRLLSEFHARAKEPLNPNLKCESDENRKE